ncbi:MAG: hypothetical protein ACRC9V_10575, partial [Aeromonas sp.]
MTAAIFLLYPYVRGGDWRGRAICQSPLAFYFYFTKGCDLHILLGGCVTNCIKPQKPIEKLNVFFVTPYIQQRKTSR